ncbi:MAG: hypothetical protein ACI9YE_001347 [Psychroserpens sp.]|jgi:hypothetical protein
MERNSTSIKYTGSFIVTYRPAVNSNLFSLAKAIEKIAVLSGNNSINEEFSAKAVERSNSYYVYNYKPSTYQWNGPS